MDELNIWITYHDELLRKNYSLEETEVYKLFNANDISIDGKNINYLNKFYSEICTLYWVYKNKKKSKMVGFCHYRRILKDWFQLKDNECIVFPPSYLSCTIYQHYKYSHNMFDLVNIMGIINEQYGNENKYTKYMLNERMFIGTCCFIMTYEYFERLCEFLFPILEEFDRRNNLNMIFDNYIEKAKREFKYENVDYQCRAVAFLSERLISCYIYTNMNVISITRTGQTTE